MSKSENFILCQGYLLPFVHETDHLHIHGVTQQLFSKCLPCANHGSKNLNVNSENDAIIFCDIV